MVIERIQAMLESCTNFPPTILYNESWLLCLVLDWFSSHQVPNHPLTFLKDARWFSEALLPRAFPHEGHTHADGVIGHFDIGKKHKADLSLVEDAKQLVILEAKLFSTLSPKTSNSRDWDQAARTVACIAEALYQAKQSPADLSRLGFYILAPQSQIHKGVFSKQIGRDAIQEKVKLRVTKCVKEGDTNKLGWFNDWFLPTFRDIKISAISWEDVLSVIEEHDFSSGSSIRLFYGQCCNRNW